MEYKFYNGSDKSVSFAFKPVISVKAHENIIFDISANCPLAIFTEMTKYKKEYDNFMEFVKAINTIYQRLASTISPMAFTVKTEEAKEEAFIEITGEYKNTMAVGEKQKIVFETNMNNVKIACDDKSIVGVSNKTYEITAKAVGNCNVYVGNKEKYQSINITVVE